MNKTTDRNCKRNKGRGRRRLLNFYRIAADDNMENGITIDDAKYLAVKLVDAE